MRGLLARTFIEQQAEGRSAVVFSHKGLKVRGGDVVWPTLMNAPLYEQAVGVAPPKNKKNNHEAFVCP